MGVFFHINPVTVTVKREAAGTFVNGKYVAGIVTNLTITASVWPTPDRSLTQAERLQRVIDSITVCSADLLYTVDTSPAKKADLVVWQGKDYEVRRIADLTSDPVLGNVAAVAFRKDSQV